MTGPRQPLGVPLLRHAWMNIPMDNVSESDASDWGDTGEWDDDDYEEFLEREFPDASERGARSGTSTPAIWKWTAWTLLALILVFWVWSAGG